MAAVIVPPAGKTRRIDLHCHSNASNEASEAVLNAMRCPESKEIRGSQAESQAESQFLFSFSGCCR